MFYACLKVISDWRSVSLNNTWKVGGEFNRGAHIKNIAEKGGVCSRGAFNRGGVYSNHYGMSTYLFAKYIRFEQMGAGILRHAAIAKIIAGKMEITKEIVSKKNEDANRQG